MSAREWASLAGDVWPIVVTVGVIVSFIFRYHNKTMRKIELAVGLQRNTIEQITRIETEVKGLDTRVVKIEDRIERNAEACDKTFRDHDRRINEHSNELQQHAARLVSLEDARRAG